MAGICIVVYILSMMLQLTSKVPTHVTRAGAASGTTLSGLTVAIAGAGPSGLLLAHRLLDEGSMCDHRHQWNIASRDVVLEAHLSTSLRAEVTPGHQKQD
eukprot:6477141-Amphidinium_carterae.1